MESALPSLDIPFVLAPSSTSIPSRSRPATRRGGAASYCGSTRECWGGRPHGIEVPELGCQKPKPEPSMSHFTRIGIDTSKAVFTLHCVDDTGRAVLQTNLRRAQMVAFFKKLPPTEIVMEVCGSALGHDVRLIPRNMSSLSSNAAKTTATTPRRSVRPVGVQ